MIVSFEKKPDVTKGKPAIASTPMKNVVPVIGSFFQSPPIFRMSCSWWQAWITLPEPRNISALKKAWVVRWKRPACQPPQPRPANMKPSWRDRRVGEHLLDVVLRDAR